MRGLVAATIGCAVAATVLIAIGDPVLVTAIGIVFGGTALVLAVSAGFYAIGRSEDRQRERDEAARRAM